MGGIYMSIDKEYVEELDMDEKETFFEILFFKELESWFSADIACCDNCVDEYIENWAGVYQKDLDFQKNSISLLSFYSGTLLSQHFSEEEFKDLIKTIDCPRCGSELYANIWPYELNVELPDDFERILKEIAETSVKTPFLLLNHTFAKSVYEYIQSIGETVKKEKLKERYYRGRKNTKDKIYKETDLFAPPKNVIKEGRYNHAGQQVLYLGENISTCFYELRLPEEGITVAEVEIRKPLKLLDFTDENLSENQILNAFKYSSLINSPREGEGWYKPHYIFTRFITDCALAAGFDGIRYPSVRFNSGNNVVIINPEAFSYISFSNIKQCNKLDI
ncbi:hypothetical protein COE31_04840 [Priestia megaterium]|nr:hypothetical protein COE31_04840 [Priestia megaterium]